MRMRVGMIMHQEQPSDRYSLHKERLRLLESIRARGIATEPVLDAMASVPREAFVEKQFRHLAYDDNALPIGLGQTISQPTVVAMMTTALDIKPGNTVLEIGTGSGYQAAVISRLAKKCVTIELHPELAARARETVSKLGIDNVEIITGDGSKGYPEGAPYDRILVTAAAPTVPDELLDQLRKSPGSRLVSPVGDQHNQSLTIVEWTEDGWSERRSGSMRFVPLRGEAGWSTTDWKRD
jgi:protein-L-isoaspartate(D-aspartate) O-methyltransferase